MFISRSRRKLLSRRRVGLLLEGAALDEVESPSAAYGSIMTSSFGEGGADDAACDDMSSTLVLRPRRGVAGGGPGLDDREDADR